MTLNVQNAKKIGIGGSKNLFDKSVAPIATSAGISVSQLSTGIRISYDSGSTVTTSKYAQFLVQDVNSYADKAITISANISASALNKARVRIGLCKSDGSDRSLKGDLDTTGSFSFTPSSAELSSRPFLYMNVFANVGDAGTIEVGDYADYTDFQVEVSPIATSYTPYVAPSEVRAIHDKDGRLLWGRLEYDTKYEGDAWQQTYTGKNLIYIEDGTRTSVDCDITVSGDTMSAVGTNTASPVIFYAYNLATPLAAGTYTLSIAEPISFQFKVTMRYDNNTNFDAIIAAGQTSVTVTTTHDVIRMSTCLGSVPIGTQVNITMRKPQLEAGSTATPYEPYVGGIPAPNPDYPQDIKVAEGPQQVTVYAPYHSKTYNFDLRGTNLYDNTKSPAYSTKASLQATDNVVRATVTQTANNVALACCIIGKTQDFLGQSITVSYSRATPSASNGQRVYLGLCDSAGTNRSAKVIVTDDVDGKKTWLVDSTVDTVRPYICLVIYASSASTGCVEGDYVDYTDLQVEVGASKTAYQPYHAPYELAKLGDYKDYIYRDADGDWYIHKATNKVVLNGTEPTWSRIAISGTTRYYTVEEPDALIITDTSVMSPIISNTLTSRTPTAIYTATVPYGISLNTSTAKFRIRNKDFSTTADFTNWLSTHNTTVYYALATATDTVVTDAVLIEKLNSIHDWLNRYGYHADVVGDLPIVINQESL